MEWPAIYARLQCDLNDSAAWGALREAVHRWAQRDLSRLGSHIVEDAVADTCAAVALKFKDARGPATFKGFVIGIYWDVRRQKRRERGVPTVSFQNIDLSPFLSASPGMLVISAT